MKTLKLYITEMLHINKNTKIIEHNYHPKTKNELQELVKKLTRERGKNPDLNDIDTSEITDMSYVFFNSMFNGDISEWDVSKVKDMSYVFFNSMFNGDISKWDVSNVKDMSYMFCRSKFNGDISKWDVSNVKDMRSTLDDCQLEKNPPKWYKK